MDSNINLKNQSWLVACVLTIGMTISCAPEKKEVSTTAEKVEVAPKEIGVQIYSARDALKEDFKGTIKKVADIGYKYVEAFGLGTDGMIKGMTPAEYKRIADSLGVKVISVHATYFTPDQADVMIKAAQELGVEYLMIPWLNEDLRVDYEAIAANFNEVGKKFQGSGIKFGYHNHAFEFEPTPDGRIPEEILIENTDPELVTFQADLYWVKKGGVDPMTLLKKYPGRFSLFHVKDADDSLNQTTVGEGIIDFEEILKAKDLSGYQYYFVEDERTDDPLGNLQKAFDHLNTLDF
ncbi:MAG: sugar phosphate isomerase/epimerase [Reichenbachiella sp.]